MQASSMEARMPGESLSAVPVLSAEAWGWWMSRSIIAVGTGLMAIGALVTFSAGAVPGQAGISGQVWWQSPELRQFAFILAGLASMLAASAIPYRWYAGLGGLAAWLLLLASLGLCGLVFVPGLGVKVNEAYRWVRVGPESLGLRFQPSEIVKVALPIFLAMWMTRGMSRDERKGLAAEAPSMGIRRFFRGFAVTVMVVGAAVGVVGLEDFGTAALIAGVAGAMLLVAGARLWHMGLLVLPAIPVFGYLLISRSHRMDRLTTFLDIWADAEGKGYQAIQSLCTIVAGGWWGVGLGQGFSKTYLPEARSDFIFAVICEEMGLPGALAVMGLFVVFLLISRTVMRRCADPMGRLLAFGIAMTLGFQALMNVAVVTVSVPTKGIALPLVSAGGSGVIFLGFLVGVMANIPRTGPKFPSAAERL